MRLFVSCDPGQIQYRATVPLCALAVNCLVKNFFFSYSLSGANVGRILAASHSRASYPPLSGGCIPPRGVARNFIWGDINFED